MGVELTKPKFGFHQIKIAGQMKAPQDNVHSVTSLVM